MATLFSSDLPTLLAGSKVGTCRTLTEPCPQGRLLPQVARQQSTDTGRVQPIADVFLTLADPYPGQMRLPGADRVFSTVSLHIAAAIPVEPAEHDRWEVRAKPVLGLLSEAELL